LVPCPLQFNVRKASHLMRHYAKSYTSQNSNVATELLNTGTQKNKVLRAKIFVFASLISATIKYQKQYAAKRKQILFPSTSTVQRLMGLTFLRETVLNGRLARYSSYPLTMLSPKPIHTLCDQNTVSWMLKRSQYWYVKDKTNVPAVVKPIMTNESQLSHYLHLSYISSLRDLTLTFYLTYIIFRRMSLRNSWKYS
jgi:hypothetical protein